MIIDFKTQAKIVRIINSCTTTDQLRTAASWLRSIRNASFKQENILHTPELELEQLISNRIKELTPRGLLNVSDHNYGLYASYYVTTEVLKV